VLVRDGWNCRYCGDLAVQVHHTRYDLSWSNPGTLVSVPPKAHRIRAHGLGLTVELALLLVLAGVVAIVFFQVRRRIGFQPAFEGSNLLSPVEVVEAPQGAVLLYLEARRWEPRRNVRNPAALT
jgi:hypothetical protein